MASSLDRDDGSASGTQQPGEGGGVRRRKAIGLLLNGMSQMTAHEQQAVVVVIVLALLGVGVKLWHLR